jgi:hypothetical protein
MATLSLMEFISFVEGFVKFVDAYNMKHLTQAKFGVRKTFHISTHLDLHMWMAIAKIITNRCFLVILCRKTGIE